MVTFRKRALRVILAQLENRRLQFGKPPVVFRHTAGGAFFFEMVTGA